MRCHPGVQPDRYVADSSLVPAARRAALVRDKTAIKNRIHAVLHQRLIPCPFSALFSVQGRHWWRTLSLDTEGRATVDSDLRLLKGLAELRGDADGVEPERIRRAG